MSKSTIRVYELEKNNFDFGLQDYEIFNEEYRPILNKAILDYFRWYEIGYDSPMMWKERINAKLNRIMRDKYNGLYLAKQTEFNPLFNIDITETYEHTIAQDTTDNGTITTESSSNSTNKNNIITSNYPSDEFISDDLTSNLFVDSGQKTETTENESNNDIQTSENTTNGNLTEKYEKKQLGSSAGLPFSKALLQLKQFYDKYDLDRQVCEELKEFFILTW